MSRTTQDKKKKIHTIYYLTNSTIQLETFFVSREDCMLVVCLKVILKEK